MENQKQKELLFNNLVNRVKTEAETAAKLSDDVKAAAEIGRCVSSLKELKSFPVSKQVMASTQADVALRHLKLHNKDRIRLMAKWLFETWKPLTKDRITDPIAVASSTKSTKHESLGKRRRIESHRVFPSKKPKMGCSRKLEQQEKEQEEKKRGYDVTSIKCSDACRIKIRAKLAEALSKVAGEVANGSDDEEIKEQVKDCDPVAVSVTVESVMFKKMGPYNGANKYKYISIMFNLGDARNQDFRRKMLLREIKAESLVSITTQEMASHERQLEIKQMNEQALVKFQEPVAAQ